MRIQHNLSAMNSLTNYHNNNNALSNNLEKLSSGYRINSAADDAAGLAISEKMRSQIAGLEKAQDNANDGISLIQTAEGALTEVNSMLTRLKSLATQSANGTYEDGVDRANIQEETEALLSEIDRISQSTNFNGINLLDGSLSGKSQVDHVAVDDTKAVKGQYVAASSVKATGDLRGLTKDDIGSTIDYTVAWINESGETKTTTVSLTFQGKGDGTIGKLTYDDSGTTKLAKASTVELNYFTDDIGNKYYLKATNADSANGTATLTASSVQLAIKSGLKADADFNAAFEVEFESTDLNLTGEKNSTTVTKNVSKLVLEAKTDGTGGAVMLGTSVKNNIKSVSDAKVTQIGGAGTASVNIAAYDSLQRFNISNLSYVGSSATKDEIAAATFEIDGSKFLLVTKDFSDDAMKALGSDVTVLRSSSADVTDKNIEDGAIHMRQVGYKRMKDNNESTIKTDAATQFTTGSSSNSPNKTVDTLDGFSTKDLAALIQKQTGRTVKDAADLSSSVSWEATKANMGDGKNKTGIKYGDIVFTDTDNKLKLDGNQLDLQVGDTNKDYQKVSVKIQDMSSKGLGLNGLDLGNQEGAAKAIDTIQNAVNSVSMQRGQLGALQNRLEHTLNNLDATDQNITAAESQIRDVDMAKEMTQYSKNNILSQAAQSMLAQANSQPQGVLSLLG